MSIQSLYVRSAGRYVILKVQDNVFYMPHFKGSTMAFCKENDQMHWRAVISVMKRKTLPSYNCLNISVPYKLVLKVDVFHSVLCSSVFSGLWLDGNLFWSFMH